MEGSVAPGAEIDGAAAPGSEADGAAAPGAEIDGAAASGSEAGGAAAPGAEIDGAAAPMSAAGGAAASGSEADGAAAPMSAAGGAAAPMSAAGGAAAPVSEPARADLAEEEAPQPPPSELPSADVAGSGPEQDVLEGPGEPEAGAAAEVPADRYPPPLDDSVDAEALMPVDLAPPTYPPPLEESIEDAAALLGTGKPVEVGQGEEDGSKWPPPLEEDDPLELLMRANAAQESEALPPQMHPLVDSAEAAAS